MDNKLVIAIAEFIGTFILLSASLLTGNPIYIAAAFLAAITLAGNFSGGHINPAVSVVMASFGKLSTSELIPYCLAQIGGALVALEIYKRFRI